MSDGASPGEKRDASGAAGVLTATEDAPLRVDGAIVASPFRAESGTAAVAVIIPARGAQRTIRQCLLSVIAQNYPNFHIYVVTGPVAEDPTIEALTEIRENSRVTCLEWIRPPDWDGRDGSVKRELGAREAIAAGADVVAFVDSQVEAPPDWITLGVQIMRQTGADGIAGVSRRHPEDSSFAAAYQDSSLFSEWPAYSEDTWLVSDNEGSAGQLPVTANLMVTAAALSRVLPRWPRQCPFGWEDFHLDKALLDTGAALICTGRLRVHRLHRRRFRLAKHVTSGMAAAHFYRAFPHDSFVRRRLLQAMVTVTVTIGFVAAVLAGLLLGAPFLLGVLAALTAAVGLGLAIASAVRAGDLRGLFFPFVDAVHIGCWLAGLVAGMFLPRPLVMRAQRRLAAMR